jgi:hypothetical protein
MDAFAGEPVWLASAAVKDRKTGRTIAVPRWTMEQNQHARAFLEEVLEGVGDPNRYRLFRMNITLCYHRALSPDERAKLPGNWDELPGGCAGGPVAVLQSKGVTNRAAAMPCQKPGRDLLDPTRPDLWRPADCGECPPCLARQKVIEQIASLRERAAA